MQNKGDAAILLTVLSVLLMVGGIAAGTLLTQKQTRTTSLAATGAHCADTPWDWNGDHHADGACGTALGYPPGSIGGPRSTAPDLGKYFLCRTPSAADTTAWSAVGDTWYGPCDTLADAQAAHDAIFGSGGGSPSSGGAPNTTTNTTTSTCNAIKTTAGCTQNQVATCQQQPVSGLGANKYYECRQAGTGYYWFGPCDYNLCVTSPSPTPTPTIVSKIKITTSIELHIRLDSTLRPVPKYFTSNLDATINTNTDPSVGAVKLSLGNLSNILTDSIGPYQSVTSDNFDITIPTDHYSSLSTATLTIKSESNFKLCGGDMAPIDQTYPLNNASEIKQYNVKSIIIEITCTGKLLSAGVKTLAYTPQEFQGMINQWNQGTLSPIEMSAYLSDLSRIPRMGWTFCDPQTGGCTAKF